MQILFFRTNPSLHYLQGFVELIQLTEPKHIPFIKTVPKLHAKQLLSAGFKLTHPLLILVQFPEIRLKVG
jgi:hypothetical protein